MKAYRPWTPDQPYLLPPNPRDWLPEGHLAPFLLEVVESLDLSAIESAIHGKDPRGERPYHPRMMLALLLYGYCTGTFSSRKIERKTYEDVAFRYLAGGEHPDFSTICTFRRVHLAAIDGLFVQVVQVSRRAGLAKLGHVSLDGTKVAANASKHKAMSYERMVADESRLRDEIAKLLARAERQDALDDERLGAGEPELDLPAELRRRTERLERIIVAQGASNQPPDTHYLVPMFERVRATTGALPAVASVDAGFWAPSNASWCEEHGVDAYISTQRQRHGAANPTQAEGQIKQAMGFRRFSMRGMEKASGEWSLVCTSHNLRKLWRARLAGIQVTLGG